VPVPQLAGYGREQYFSGTESTVELDYPRNFNVTENHLLHFFTVGSSGET
jgi:hypothetical protein